MLTRRGATLIELMIALGVASVVLGIVASISVREQRVFGDLANQAAVTGQLREAAAVLPTDLRAISPGAGDIAAGEARDTSLQLRGTIASGIICDTSAGGIVLPPAGTGANAFASGTSAIQAGDTVWLFTPTPTDEMWAPYRVSSVASGAPSQCASAGPVLDAATRTHSRTVLTLANPPSSTAAAVGLPVRITRPLRYSLYRASDGAWYVGERDWNASTQRFNTIQPLAGPMLSASRGGLAFQYFDSLGTQLAAPVANPAGVAMIRIVLRGETRDAARALAVAKDIGKPTTDSTAMSLLLHNRR